LHNQGVPGDDSGEQVVLWNYLIDKMRFEYRSIDMTGMNLDKGEKKVKSGIFGQI
jgi:hypothetical protein